VLLAWPHGGTDWAPLLPAVEAVYTAITRAVAAREPALIVCASAEHLRHVRARLGEAGVALASVRLYVAATNDTWTRDYGPLTVLEAGRALLLDFTFDGWGGKFRADLDDTVTRRLHAAGAFADAPVVTPGRVLEGGSIESDGAGTLMTTRRCLMSRAGPHATPATVEAELQALLGAERVLWLEHGGLEGDDTDGHVDTLARFCDPGTIAYVRCEDPADTHHADLAAMERELRAFRRVDGTPYRLVPLPLPAPKRGPDGERLPATYANFLIVNGAVLVPTYDDPADAEALERLAACFPDRQAVGIPCGPLIRQHGSLHCATMQIPREVWRT
jgi:agmatine/peptidylarginine deiminase